MIQIIRGCNISGAVGNNKPGMNPLLDVFVDDNGGPTLAEALIPGVRAFTQAIVVGAETVWARSSQPIIGAGRDRIPRGDGVILARLSAARFCSGRSMLGDLRFLHTEDVSYSTHIGQNWHFLNRFWPAMKNQGSTPVKGRERWSGMA